MQIHELTKRNKRTDEGLLDGISNAITAAKTGFQTASDAFSTNQRVSDQEKRNANAAKIARQMAARGYNVDTSDPTVKDGSGQTRVAGGTIPSVMADNELRQAAKTAAAKFTAATTATPEFANIIYNEPAGEPAAEPDQAQNTQAQTNQPVQPTQGPEGLGDTSLPPAPQPGHRLVIDPKVSGWDTKFYYNPNGKWTNEINQPVTHPDTINKLNSWYSGGGAKEEQIPGYQAPKAAKTPKTAPTQATKPVQPTAPAKSLEEVANNKRKANRLATGKTKAPAPQPTTATVPDASAPINDKKIDTTLTNIAASKDVMQSYSKFSQQFKTTPREVEERPEVKQAWQQVVNAGKSRMKQGKKERLEKAFQNYATSVLTAMKAVGTGEETTTNDGSEDTANAISGASSTISPAQQAQATQQLAKVSGVDAQTINKVKNAVQQNPAAKPVAKKAIGLDEQLSRELHKLRFATLYEDSVQITKDIVVKTNLGNYVKKAEDQTWHDPNGVPIDPVKYADYIKKLDATPAAQTRYQADSLSGRGSDTAFNKARAPKQQPVPQTAAQAQVPTFSPEEAMARLKQMDDYNHIQAMLRDNNVQGLNSMVQDTFNQLQNAKIFKTGQEDYLRDRMAALMAMKA